jgi:hypothetical protein
MAGEELDAVRREIATWRWTGPCQRGGATDASWQVRLRSPKDVCVPSDVELRIWPISVPPASRSPDVATDGRLEVTFPISTEGLTAFFAFELRRGDHETRGVLKARLEGVPEDRHQRLLAGLIGDADRLLRYLLLLLADASGAGDAGAAVGRWLDATSG